ncbi:MAG: hypothetical protein R3E95_11855 [Thiolinea sp.]
MTTEFVETQKSGRVWTPGLADDPDRFILSHLGHNPGLEQRLIAHIKPSTRLQLGNRTRERVRATDAAQVSIPILVLRVGDLYHCDRDDQASTLQLFITLIVRSAVASWLLAGGLLGLALR